MSEIRVSKIRGSEIRVSEIRVSEIRISSNHCELHGAIFWGVFDFCVPHHSTVERCRESNIKTKLLCFLLCQNVCGIEKIIEVPTPAPSVAEIGSILIETHARLIKGRRIDHQRRQIFSPFVTNTVLLGLLAFLATSHTFLHQHSTTTSLFPHRIKIANFTPSKASNKIWKRAPVQFDFSTCTTTTYRRWKILVAGGLGLSPLDQLGQSLKSPMTLRTLEDSLVNLILHI